MYSGTDRIGLYYYTSSHGGFPYPPPPSLCHDVYHFWTHITGRDHAFAANIRCRVAATRGKAVCSPAPARARSGLIQAGLAVVPARAAAARKHRGDARAVARRISRTISVAGTAVSRGPG